MVSLHIALAVRVKRAGFGVLSMLLYSDNGMVLSEHHILLHGMLNTLSEYGRDLTAMFSKKSHVLVINGDASDAARTYIFGGNDI